MTGQKKPFLFTLRNHKKKCIFFTAAGIWGIHFGVQQFRNYLQRREFCHESKDSYGNVIIPAVKKPRRLLLFLNPEANNGKALKSYEKNAAPILHLGGLEITTIKTDYEGQCKALTQYIDPSIDGIIVAGGDGTLMEVLTGLLRRRDQELISKIPIGLIPLGKNNHSYDKILGTGHCEDEVKKIGNAAINILEEKTKDVSIMEIKSSEERPTYAVDHIEWGPLRDVKESNRFWWTGPLKRRLPYLFKVLKGWPPSISADISFSLCNDDSSNLEKKQTHIKKEESQVDNRISSLGFFVKLLEDKTKPFLHTSILSSNISKTDFIKNGWSLENEGQFSTKDDISTTNAAELELKPIENEPSWFTIDGEKFEARPIHVKILPNKIKLFCHS